jgi:CRP-like cAMP-binding protein
MQLNQVRQFYEKFIPLSNEEWALLEPNFRMLRLSKGEKLHSEGDSCSDVTFVNKGLMKCYHFIDGKEYIEAFFSQNEYCSDYSSFLLREPGKLYIEALEECELVLLDYNTVQMLYDKVKNFQKFGRLMAEFLFTQISIRNNALLFETPETRYKKFSKNRPDLLQRVPQYMIASYLGVTPEALSRIRKRLLITT